jgi:hypothetical protein
VTPTELAGLLGVGALSGLGAVAVVLAADWLWQRISR